jgi:hypothetical protein
MQENVANNLLLLPPSTLTLTYRQGNSTMQSLLRGPQQRLSVNTVWLDQLSDWRAS